MHATQTHRDDIQALRAVAVLSVIFYHFQVAGFSGGFVGVDIFFVISGYLITGKILRETSAGRFSFFEFCRSRARRLLPTLLVTVAISYAAGAFLFSPLDFQRQSDSTMLALFGVSNIGFWREAGYFDAAANLKPLLHTWSLAVELQFYLIWPLVILLITKRAPVATLAVLTAIGFAAAVYMSNIDQNSAFFLMPFRIWEFSIGGLIYAVERKFPQTGVIGNGGYLLGAVATLFPIFAYSDLTPFPGASALLPVTGAAAMILFGKSAAAKLASIRPAIFIGEISYSAYLVHWPLIVFVQYALLRDLTWVEKTALVGATLVLSLILYFTIEQPFRRPLRLRIVPPSLIYAVLMAGVLAPAYNSNADGWAWRVPEEFHAVNNFLVGDMQNFTWHTWPALGPRPHAFDGPKPNLLVIGDSQASDVINMITSTTAADKYDIEFYRIELMCGVILVPSEKQDAYWTRENVMVKKFPASVAPCKASQEELFSSPDVAKADVIIIASEWREHHLPYIDDTLAFLRAKSTAPIYLVGRKDLKRGSPEIVSDFGRLVGLERFAAKYRDAENDTINQKLAAITSKRGDTFIDPMTFYCSVGQCDVLTGGKPIFYDHSHLTPEGAKLFGQKLVSDLPKLPLLASSSDRPSGG